MLDSMMDFVKDGPLREDNSPSVLNFFLKSGPVDTRSENSGLLADLKL